MKNSKECINCYNMIIAGGSIPPMLAALEAILNGYETYAYIGRGRLYNGIEYTDKFHNLGFDVTKTQSLETEEVFDLACRQIKKIKSEDKNAFFNFYIDESRALKAAAIAANAELGKNDFHVFMLEDGIHTYKKFALFYGGKTGYRPLKAFFLKLTGREWLSDHTASFIADRLSVFTSKDNSHLKKLFNRMVRKDFEKTTELTRSHFEAIMSVKNNSCRNSIFAPNYKTPFAVASLENFTYMLQNKSKIDNILVSAGNTRLMELFGVPGHSKVSGGPEIVSGSIYHRVNRLSSEQKDRYMTLMFREYIDELNSNFSREMRGDMTAPVKKLIYVSSRFDTMFIKPVTDMKYGIGGIIRNEDIPQSYETLPDKYKSIFLFPCSEDYEILYSAIKNEIYSKKAPPEAEKKAAAKVFNLYADYIFVAKMLYMIYGSEYDFVVKNHPRTDLGTSFEWADSYKIRYDGGYIDSGICLDKALTEFFARDSSGRYIGVLSGSLSTENFEYLGADVSFGGQPSSVYNGLSDDANIMFIITDSDGAVSGGGNSHFDYSAVSGLYKSGLLKYKDKNGDLQDAVFYNTGNTLKACAHLARKSADDKLADFYTDLYKKWLEKTHGNAQDINLQGFSV